MVEEIFKIYIQTHKKNSTIALENQMFVEKIDRKQKQRFVDRNAKKNELMKNLLKQKPNVLNQNGKMRLNSLLWQK